jgi:hypothetical protein
MAYPDFEDEKNRTERMLNECMVNKLVFFLNETYRADHAYPGKERWADMINEKYLGKAHQDCAKLLTYESGNIKDYFGDDIQYEFKSEKEIVVYSRNSKYLSEETREGDFPLMAFSLEDGKAKVFPLKN